MKKVLVIEDREQTRNLFLECLKAKGFYTIGAENGLIGVQQAREHLPDLVICDIMMPLLDGYGVLTQLRKDIDTATIPFIFVTAKVNRTDFRKGMELGADDYLTKPCTVEELLRAIATQLEKQAVHHRWRATKPKQVIEESFTEAEAFFANSKSMFLSIPQLSKVFDFIEANYHQPITLDDVARSAGYSRSYLADLVRSQTGQTINRWIVERRMAEVRSLLLQTNCSLEEIAAAVGYQNQCHFFRQFRQYHGLTPQAWRKMQQTQLATKKEQTNC